LGDTVRCMREEGGADGVYPMRDGKRAQTHEGNWVAAIPIDTKQTARHFLPYVPLDPMQTLHFQ
jgi:hypothetical protein